MSELAINGGSPACPLGLIPEWPRCGPEEFEAVQRVARSGKWWRGAGTEVDEFEAEFAAFHECRHALAVSNGTQALEIALFCLGVGFGDEVIVPAFTFIATATSVLSVGAIPVTVDVDLATYCMDVACARSAVTPRTKSIIPVHLAGQPCDMNELMRLSHETGIPILSDCAHAHGARWNGTSLAKLVPASMYSFQSLKLLSAGEGGALVTDDERIYHQAWLRHTYGRPKGDRNYVHLHLGTNCRMTEFHAALLRPQLARLSSMLQIREEGYQRLTDHLTGMDGIILPIYNASATTHSHYMFMLRIEPERLDVDRDSMVAALVAEGVPAYRTYPCIPDLEMFSRSALWNGNVPDQLKISNIRDALHRQAYSNAKEISRNGIWLHHSVLLGGASVQEKVAEAFYKVCSRSSELLSAVADARS